MRNVLLLLILGSSLLVNAQPTVPANLAANHYFGRSDSSHLVQAFKGPKWFLSSTSAIGIGFDFFRGGSAKWIAAPVGLQLNRRLDDNLFAFAGVTVAPAFVFFNQPFLSRNVNKMTSGVNNTSLNPNLYSRMDIGLMYINNARTFSVSGSIGVERGINPYYFYPQTNGSRLNIPSNR